MAKKCKITLEYDNTAVVVFTAYPLGEEYPVIVTSDIKTYKKFCVALKNNQFHWFTFEVVAIAPTSMKALCHNADDRGVSKNGWYAHSRNHNYNYRKEALREGVRVIDINCHKNMAKI